MIDLTRKLVAEATGTLLLVATVVGSGIMAEQLADGNTAIALLGNTIPTGAILFVIITVFGPISGAHFNPVVTLVFMIRKEITFNHTIGYWIAQICGALLGAIIAHIMFDLTLIQTSLTARTGIPQWFAEIVATFGLVTTILGCLYKSPDRIPTAVALYITAAYWFTASTSFANPAVTIGRSISHTFAGIAPSDVTGFIFAQIIGALLAAYFCLWMFRTEKKRQAKKPAVLSNIWSVQSD
ncbi:MAG: glycerol uptake facilitator-like aquaporin [Gammaproteobacteria bacterium]|jgi:glycerol uptake facilitator-like aquaporin